MENEKLQGHRRCGLRFFCASAARRGSCHDVALQGWAIGGDHRARSHRFELTMKAVQSAGGRPPTPSEPYLGYGFNRRAAKRTIEGARRTPSMRPDRRRDRLALDIEMRSCRARPRSGAGHQAAADCSRAVALIPGAGWSVEDRGPRRRAGRRR